MKRVFKHEIESFLSIFNGLSFKQTKITFLEDEDPNLNKEQRKAIILLYKISAMHLLPRIKFTRIVFNKYRELAKNTDLQVINYCSLEAEKAIEKAQVPIFLNNLHFFFKHLLSYMPFLIKLQGYSSYFETLSIAT